MAASAPQPRALRTLAEIYAAGLRDGAAQPPLTQEQVDYCFALLAPYLDTILATRQAAPAAHLTTEELAARLHTTPGASAPCTAAALAP